MALILFACTSMTTNNNSPQSHAAVFFNSAESTTPVFKPTTAESSSITPITAKTPPQNWGSGLPIYSVYYSLREFIHDRDEGHVDRSNLYKLIYDVDTVYSGTSELASTLNEQTVVPPFNALPSVVCNRGINNTDGNNAIVLKETTETIDAIITWIWSDQPNKNEYGIAAIHFDKITNNITIDMTYCVDYDTSTPTTDYNMRCHVNGNASANAFEYQYILSYMNNTYDVIVAKGISRGAGNYMLFKYRDNGTTKYLVAPGDADETYFSNEYSSPTHTYTDPNELPASVADYKDWVVQTGFFESTDLVTDTRHFNSGNSKQGTIFLNFTP